jgi:two-component system C4-dicarboxylate transport sensor histidine kinase DctB
MNRLAAWVTEHRFASRAAAMLVVLCIAAAIAFSLRLQQEREQFAQLELEAAHRGVAIMSQTLNGNVMGSMALFGLTDEDVKRDARGDGGVNRSRLTAAFETVGRAFGADGIFVVDESGIVQTSWDSSGKPSTGVNVRFRPYYQIALKGRANVYAAVSLARGDRSLYFTAPIYDAGTGSRAIGGVVARTTLAQVDSLLRGEKGIALLLSPQGIVFAGSNNEWVGYMASQPTPDKLKALREIKQFGDMFEKRDPRVLPFSINEGVSHFAGRRYAVADALIQWNDPSGEWRLVLMEDLALAVPPARTAWIASLAALILATMAYLIFKVLRKHHAQLVANRRLDLYAKAQQAAAERKSRMAGASLRLHQAEDFKTLASTFLAIAHDMFGSLQGTAYAYESENAEPMRLMSSYGCDGMEQQVLRPGQGLLGQCVLEKKMRVLAAPGEGYWKIRSGLGSANPKMVVMIPIQHNQKVIGAVELALLRSLGEDELEQIEELAALFAVNLEIQRRHLSAREATL